MNDLQATWTLLGPVHALHAFSVIIIISACLDCVMCTYFVLRYPENYKGDTNRERFFRNVWNKEFRTMVGNLMLVWWVFFTLGNVVEVMK